MPQVNINQSITENLIKKQVLADGKAPTLEQLRFIGKRVLSHYQQGDNWEKHKDRYRSPNGYCAWNKYVPHYLFHSSFESMEMARISGDSAGMLVNKVCTQAVEANAPARYISRELCDSFLRTPHPAITAEMLDILPVFHILLPKGCLVSEDGLDVLALIVKTGEMYPRLADAERIEAGEHAKKNGHKIIPKEMEGACGVQVAAMTEVFSYSWMHFLDDSFNKRCFAETVNTEVKNLTEAIGRIAINSLLIHLYEPELITTDSSVGFRSGSGFQSSPSKTLPPTWIGKSFRSDRDSHRCSSGSDASRNPVQPHWRRGHWHTVLHGPGRSERRMQWFRPVYVNASR